MWNPVTRNYFQEGRLIRLTCHPTRSLSDTTICMYKSTNYTTGRVIGRLSYLVG